MDVKVAFSQSLHFEIYSESLNNCLKDKSSRKATISVTDTNQEHYCHFRASVANKLRLCVM